MPQPYSFPTLYNEALQINISKLKEWGYLQPGQFKAGTLTWKRNGNITGSVSIQGRISNEKQYIELEYKYRGEPRKYKVQLVSTPSNLGKGKVWYFLCPKTLKRCRVLYSIGGYFFHREAFKGCLYESQTHNKKYRQLDKTFGAYFRAERYYDQIYRKHFKKTYAGKPTRKYLKLSKAIERVEQTPLPDFTRLLK